MHKQKVGSYSTPEIWRSYSKYYLTSFFFSQTSTQWSKSMPKDKT